MFWSSVFLLCAMLACAHALLWVRWRRARKLVAGLPSLPGLPLIGNIHQFLFRDVISLLEEISKVKNEHRLPNIFRIGPIPVVVLTEPAHVKTVNSVCLEKAYIYKFGETVFGKGLLSAPAPLHKHTSKKLSGSFTSSVVAGYQDMFNMFANKMVGELRGEVGGAPFDVLRKYILKTSLDAIYKISSRKVDTENAITPEYHYAFNRIMLLYVQRALNLFVHWDCLYHLTPAYREEKTCADVINALATKAIEERKKEREDFKKETSVETHKTESGRNVFRPYLDILLEQAETDPVFTNQQILAEMNTVLIAGHVTVSNTLLMCLIMIGKRHDLQDKLHREIKEVFGDSQRALEKDDLDRMEYCEAVINEFLRLFPPVPAAARIADRDVVLDSCTIPAGSVCITNIWGSGRSKRLWGADAEQFRPERWLQKDYSKDAVLLAFNYGKRACIGKKYAMSFVKTVIVHCLREFVIEAEAKELRFKFGITWDLVSGHKIQVHLRQRIF